MPSDTANIPPQHLDRRYAVHGQLSVKLSEVTLQVMHGTWIAWRLYDSVLFVKDSDASVSALDFGVDLTSQMIEISSNLHEGKDGQSQPSIRLPLPHFTLSGRYSLRCVQASAAIGYFAVSLKPQYVDDILAVQQKFGSDFVDILQLFAENRTSSASKLEKPDEVKSSLALKATAKLEGFAIALEGPSSTQYLNCAVIEGHVSKETGPDVLWDARCSSISLSLAHHSTLPASSFDRKIRSAYMDIEFDVNNTRPAKFLAEDQHFNLRIIRIHAVMQPASIGELGDLVDYVQVSNSILSPESI